MTFLNLNLKLPLFHMPNLSIIAINAALLNDWNKAISVNKDIIKENPNDLNALNRLAFALTQTCVIDEAKKIYKKILTIDKYNLIAIKNLEKINNLHSRKKSKLNTKKTTSFLSPSLFIEEPGKTKTVTLANPASSEILSGVNIGDPVNLHPKKHSIEIRDFQNTYLGALPDDIAFRLIRLLKSGNIYRVNIKNITKNSIAVFISETKRGKRFANQPSFLTSYSQRSSLYPPHAKNAYEETETGDETKSNQDEDEE